MLKVVPLPFDFHLILHLLHGRCVDFTALSIKLIFRSSGMFQGNASVTTHYVSETILANIKPD